VGVGVKVTKACEKRITQLDKQKSAETLCKYVTFAQFQANNDKQILHKTLPLHYDDAMKLAKTKINTLKGVQYPLDTMNIEKVK